MLPLFGIAAPQGYLPLQPNHKEEALSAHQNSAAPSLLERAVNRLVNIQPPSLFIASYRLDNRMRCRLSINRHFPTEFRIDFIANSRIAWFNPSYTIPFLRNRADQLFLSLPSTLFDGSNSDTEAWIEARLQSPQTIIINQLIACILKNSQISGGSSSFYTDIMNYRSNALNKKQQAAMSRLGWEYAGNHDTEIQSKRIYCMTKEAAMKVLTLHPAKQNSDFSIEIALRSLERSD